METLFLIVFFLAVCAGPYGLFLALFKKGKRMRGVKVMGGALVAFIASAIAIGISQNSVASRAGFESYTTYQEALEAGVTDPDVWAAEGAQILGEQEAQRAQEAEAAEAERIRQAEEVEAERLVEEAERIRQAEEAEAERLVEEAERIRQAEEAEAERLALEQQERDEETRRGFHCLSSWDGSHREFRNAVRDSMREPDSFEHIETRVTPVNDDGMHAIIMQYRARNGFGGMNVGTALGQYRNNDCSYTILSIE